jgi:hypothetical protein
MNKNEASKILTESLVKYRELSYHQLRQQIDRVETEEVVGPSGTWYYLEFQILWDGKPDGDIRVMGSIDDGGLRAFGLFTDSFIKGPSGEFVGE